MHFLRDHGALFLLHREELQQSHRSHQCICSPSLSGKAESRTGITHLPALHLFLLSAQVQKPVPKQVMAGQSSLTLQTKASQVSLSAKAWTLLWSERISTSTVMFYSLLFNLNMNKVPNPGYHSIHSHEEADTASKSQGHKTNPSVPARSKHFFNIYKVYCFFPEAMTGTAFFQSHSSSSSHICHPSWHLLAPW